MLITFRQGIISYQDTPNFFLVLTGGNVNLNADRIPTDITLAHGTVDYLFTESQSIIGAWSGPFVNGTNYWLYWDIDNFTGQRTFGSTTVDPFQANGYGLDFPSSPQVDQHFFNTTINKMHVWNGSRWVEKIRLFAAKITSGGILQSIAIGSQIGVTSKRTAGHILFDNNGLPIKTSDRFGMGYFVTTETYLNSQVDRNNSYKLEALHPTGKAIEPIPQYYCVSWKDVNQLGVASYKDPLHPCIGISSVPMGVNEVSPFITDGFISNFANWNFTDPPGTILWVGITGEITTAVPQDTSMQEIGYVVSPDTVFISLRRVILIDGLPNITATPTPTPVPSLTPTVTPTVTPTLTPTLTPTITPSVTPIVACTYYDGTNPGIYGIGFMFFAQGNYTWQGNGVGWVNNYSTCCNGIFPGDVPAQGFSNFNTAYVPYINNLRITVDITNAAGAEDGPVLILSNGTRFNPTSFSGNLATYELTVSETNELLANAWAAMYADRFSYAYFLPITLIEFCSFIGQPPPGV